jgi:menaquinone-dependent protoporphyrinogen oxidase
MGDKRVLVAFANQAGSTAGIANTIAGVLRRSGYAVDCRVASEVTDLAPYAAVVLGSGVFVPRRRSDGGGFLARHEAALRARSLWLFCAGPIGRGRCPAGTTAAATVDCSVVTVARQVGARGAAVFGPIGLPADADPMEQLAPVNVQRVRAWAAEIAAQLRATGVATRREPLRPHGHRCRRTGVGDPVMGPEAVTA